jgi:serine/threonine protein kinase
MFANKTCPSCQQEVSATMSRCPRDGTDMSSAYDPVMAALAEEPRFLGTYEFLGQIGAGGMGVIYKARQIVINKMVAVKMVHSHLVSPEAFQRFQIEGKAAQLITHPYIIAVYDFGMTANGSPYMVMDYVKGKTLAEVISQEGTLSNTRFLRIFTQVCEALVHAHSKGVLHRDLKPSNIMLIQDNSGREEIRIMDFGIAKLVNDTESSGQHLTKTGEAIGSPLYMSPEQARGENTDFRSDIYSLGCVMYESLAGVPPLVGQTPLNTMLMHLNDIPVPVRQKAGSQGMKIEYSIEQVVMNLLEKDREDRYQSMELLLKDLRRIQAYQQPANQPTLKLVAAKNQKKKLWMIAGGAALSCILAAGLFTCLFPDFFKAPPKSDRKVKVDGMDKPSSASDTVEQELNKVVSNKNQNLDLHRIRQTSSSESDVPLSLLKPNAFAFFTRLSFQDSHLNDKMIEPIGNATNVVYANFENNHLANLEILPKLEKLEVLSFFNNDISPEGLKNIGKLKNLVALSLRKNDLHDEDLQYLYNLKNLQALDISGCPNLHKGAIDALQANLSNCCVLSGPINSNIGHEAEYLFLMKPSVLEGGKDPKGWRQAVRLLDEAISLLKNEPDEKFYFILDLCLAKKIDCLFKLNERDAAAPILQEELDLDKKCQPSSARRPYAKAELANIKEHARPDLPEYQLRQEALDEWAALKEPDAYFLQVDTLIDNAKKLEQHYKATGKNQEANDTYGKEKLLLLNLSVNPHFIKPWPFELPLIDLVTKRLKEIEKEASQLSSQSQPPNASEATSTEAPTKP